ncbi:Chloroperoxidase [Aspergillus filifer]
MKFSLQTVLSLMGLASATPYHDKHQWKPPGHDDFRGPCPMMNTLANHGYLPHDGRNLTRPVVVNALNQALHFNASLGNLMFDMALVANPEEGADWFTLDHLNRHNVLEHDASLSRADAYFGSNHIFNATIFAQTQHFWTDKNTLTAAMLANSKIARQVISKAFNPNYTFTDTTENFSLGEVAAPIIVFGDMEEGTVERNFVEYFFTNERLPHELGWQRKSKEVTLADISFVTAMVGEATNLITGSSSSSASASKQKRMADLHAGWGF